ISTRLGVDKRILNQAEDFSPLGSSPCSGPATNGINSAGKRKERQNESACLFNSLSCAACDGRWSNRCTCVRQGDARLFLGRVVRPMQNAIASLGADGVD